MRKTRRIKRGGTRKKTAAPKPGPSQCHPRVGGSRPAHGCLPESILKRAAAKLNISTNKSATSLRHQLEKKLHIQEGQDSSFLKALPFGQGEKEYLQKTYLRPSMPDTWKNDPDMWLDSTNIEAVMKQYEEARPDFKFMGPFPIDFAAPDPYEKSSGGQPKCLIREICGFEIKEAEKNGIRYVGTIYNLDPHFKDGSHWVATFIDMPMHKCYYFDSYGYEPPKQIEKFMKWLTTQDPKMKLAYNARRFQLQGSECGMYSMYFIIRMLSGDAFRPFCRVQPRDGVMLDFRDWLFST